MGRAVSNYQVTEKKALMAFRGGATVSQERQSVSADTTARGGGQGAMFWKFNREEMPGPPLGAAIWGLGGVTGQFSGVSHYCYDCRFTR